MNFAERFCARHYIPDADFERVVLDRSLHPAARLLCGTLVFFFRDYFAADFEFVRNVGRLTHVRDFSVEASVFWHHPANSGWLRRRLRLRLSTHRLLGLMEATMRTRAIPPTVIRAASA